jgi:hypothetical protein
VGLLGDVDASFGTRSANELSAVGGGRADEAAGSAGSVGGSIDLATPDAGVGCSAVVLGVTVDAPVSGGDAGCSTVEPGVTDGGSGNELDSGEGSTLIVLAAGASLAAGAGAGTATAHITVAVMAKSRMSSIVPSNSRPGLPVPYSNAPRPPEPNHFKPARRRGGAGVSEVPGS